MSTLCPECGTLGTHSIGCRAVRSMEPGDLPTVAVKHDTEKNRLDLLSPWATEGLGRVLTFGAKEYGADNWRKGMEWRRLIAAAKRHLSAFERGENFDLISQLPHIDHAAACIHFLSEYQKTSNGNDDRWVKP